jgi:hypothetical protein
MPNADVINNNSWSFSKNNDSNFKHRKEHSTFFGPLNDNFVLKDCTEFRNSSLIKYTDVPISEKNKKVN